MENSTGRAWIELDRAALRHNVEALRSLLPDGCELMPAIKANAYGHGAVLIAKELIALGVRAFCVATVHEGVELRESGVTGDILILGYTAPWEFALLRQYDLIQTVVDSQYAAELDRYGEPLRVHLKIDTGMRRLGERAEQIDRIAAIFRYRNLSIEGVYTHLCADDTKTARDAAFTRTQAGAFNDMISELEQRGFLCMKRHLLASYGLLNYPELGGDYARVGIALYGVLSNRADLEHCPIRLEPVLSLKARIALVKDVHQGESVGYGLTYTADRDRRIAVLTIGYADGLPRALSNGKGRVLINGMIAPIIGRICMDQTMVDVTGIPGVEQGGVAVIIGKSGANEITAYDLAEQSGTITNEILSRLVTRVERVMLESQTQTEVIANKIGALVHELTDLGASPEDIMTEVAHCVGRLVRSHEDTSQD